MSGIIGNLTISFSVLHCEIWPRESILTFESNGSQSLVPGPAASSSPANLLEMQIPRFRLRSTISEILELGPKNMYLNNPSR